MPSKTSDNAQAPEPTVELSDLQTFFFPTIGNGISVKARTLAEAEELAKKLA